MVRNNTQSFSLRSVLEKDKLNGTNYADWIRNLRIVLRAEKKEDVLEYPVTVQDFPEGFEDGKFNPAL